MCGLRWNVTPMPVRKRTVPGGRNCLSKTPGTLPMRESHSFRLPAPQNPLYCFAVA